MLNSEQAARLKKMEEEEKKKKAAFRKKVSTRTLNSCVYTPQQLNWIVLVYIIK